MQQSKDKIARLEEQKTQLSTKLESISQGSGGEGTGGSGGGDHRQAIGGGHPSAAATDLRISGVEMEKEELQAQLLVCIVNNALRYP